VLAAAHLDHNPANNRLRNLRSFCQRCHPAIWRNDGSLNLLRRALGDLFLGPYRVG
jgi:hypothetical protein